MNEYPNFNIVGEEWSDNPIVNFLLAKRIKLIMMVMFLTYQHSWTFLFKYHFVEALTDDFSWGKGFIKPYRIFS